MQINFLHKFWMGDLNGNWNKRRKNFTINEQSTYGKVIIGRKIRTCYERQHNFKGRKSKTKNGTRRVKE